MEIKPYVYRGLNRDTGEFYIGYRETNQYPALHDLGIKYFTSSRLINKNNFKHFDWEILSEHTTGDEAYWEEQKLIKQNIHDPLCLNGNYVDPDTKKTKFSIAGTKQPTISMKMKGNQNGKGHINSLEFIERMKGNSYAKGIKHTEEQRASKSARMKGNKYGLGHVQSKEQIEAHSARLKKPIMAGGIEFTSSREAAAYYSITPGTVTYRLNSDNYTDWYRLS